jgi:hypothetical protein
VLSDQAVEPVAAVIGASVALAEPQARYPKASVLIQAPERVEPAELGAEE